MKKDGFMYSGYCTAFYAPELAAVVVYDEIGEKELRTHSTQYAEDCAWSTLRYKLIDIDQFTAAMRVLYP